MERALRLVADKIPTVTFSADVIRIVTECADSYGRALRTIRRVRKCVCDWGIRLMFLNTELIFDVCFNMLLPCRGWLDIIIEQDR